MSKKVFVINGSAGVGKDTFCNLVGKFTKVRIVSSVDPIKYLAKLTGWNGVKDEKSRKFLSDLKDLTTAFNDYPMECLKTCYKEFMEWETDEAILFIHIREPKEVLRACTEFNAKSILVINTNIKHIASNHADSEVYDYKYDYIIDNSGSLNSLRNVASRFVYDIQLR